MTTDAAHRPPQRNPRRLLFVGAAYAMVGAIAITWFLCRGPLSPSQNWAAPDGTDEVELVGVVRDFRRSHPDFAETPSNGLGHAAGNVQLRLQARQRPGLSEDGYRVDEQWRDASNRPIPPHLAGVRGWITGTDSLGLRVSGKIEMEKETVIDAFTSARGPYGVAGNHGGLAYVSTNSTAHDAVKIDKEAVVRGRLDVGPGGDPDDVVEDKGLITGGVGVLDTTFVLPAPTPPEDLGSYTEHLDIDGPVTLTGDTTPDDETDDPAMHVGHLHIKDHAEVTVEGDLVIYCDQELKIDRAQIELLPDATLTIVVADGDVKIKHDTIINVAEHGTTAFTLIALGPGKVKLEDNTHLYGTIIAPERKLELKRAQLCGAFVGAEVKLDDKGSAIHIDVANAEPGAWNPAVTVREKIEIEDFCLVDSFDSNVGPYGGANVGDDALLMTNATKSDSVKIKKHTDVHGDVMVGPTSNPSKVVEIKDGSSVSGMIGSMPLPGSIPVIAPPFMGERVDDVEYEGGEHTISGDLYCKKLKIEKGATVSIAGHVTIRCDDKVEIKDHSKLELLPASSLTLYVEKGVKVEKHSELNMNTGNPQLVSIRHSTIGKKGKVEIKKHSKVVAWILGGKTELKVEEHSEFFGSIAGEKIKVKKHSQLHVDMAGLAACLAVDDDAGEAGDQDDGGITSAETFQHWYTDALGQNLSKLHPITLTRAADGVYEYLSDDFHPIDDEMFGNEGETHNNYFTYAINATFEYDECSGGFIEFEGGDGFWLFVDGQLAMDLGGVGASVGQYLEIDRIGLDTGTHELGLFFAQRRQSESVFRLRTNLRLHPTPVPPVTWQYD